MVIQHIGEVGGSGIGLLAILNMLKDKFDIVVYCVKEPDGLTKLLIKNGYTVKTVPSIPLFGYLSGGPGLFNIDFLLPFFRIKKGMKEWARLFREEAPDVVLANSMVLSWMIPVIKQNCDAKAICYVREVLPNRWDPRARKILGNLELFDAVWFISEHERKYFLLQHPSTCVIRDSLTGKAPDLKESEDKIIDDNVFRVLYVGGLSALKGINTVMRSIKYLDPQIIIDIAGNLSQYRFDNNKDASFFKIIKNYIFTIKSVPRNIMYKQLRTVHRMYPERMNLIGHRNSLEDLYKNCHVLIFPSMKPHQSRPAFEAGFYKKPVIISDFKQTRENVVDGYNGLTVKPNDPKALAYAINRLAYDRDLCKRMGHNNRIESIKKNTFEAVEIEMDGFWREFSL